jgi:hypothetical protein
MLLFRACLLCRIINAVSSPSNEICSIVNDESTWVGEYSVLTCSRILSASCFLYGSETWSCHREGNTQVLNVKKVLRRIFGYRRK